MQSLHRAVVAIASILWAAGSAIGEDWPTFQHDNHRSATTAEKLDAEDLEIAWSREFAPSQTAWPAPAKWDAYRGLRGLKSMRAYDPASYVIVVGDAVYFGSSADDAIRCLDAETGHERWAFFADGPVRIAPAWHDGRIYFGADDGYAYCLRADDGGLEWRFRPAAAERLILNNGRFIPFWPCRSGVLVDGGIAYFTTGLLPWKESYLCSLDAKTGEPHGEYQFVNRLEGVTVEGALLASSRHLFVPQGRLPPLVFDRADGKQLGSLKGGGGCFALVTSDEQLLHGPGNKTGWITQSNVESRTQVATYQGGNAMVVSGDVAYVLSDHSLIAMNRASREELWRVDCQHPYSLILAGDTLFAGGDDSIAAIDTNDGKMLWTHEVKGRAYGLAVADGGLFVSTDEGHLDCFRPDSDNTRLADVKRKAETPVPVAADRNATASQGNADEIEVIQDRNLLGRWVMHERLFRGHRIADLAGNQDGTVFGRLRIEPAGDHEALVLDGLSASVLLAADHKQARMPSREITAEARVRIDEPLPWGGLIGAVQDNGDDERGWLLGYVESKFSFALCGKQGTGRLTFLTAKSDFVPGQWYHVAGTYDGQAMRVYVDGQLANESDEQAGPIHYPPQAFYEIGAYHDKDEYYRGSGLVNEVRVYDRVLSAEELRQRARSKQFPAPPRAGLDAAEILAELELPPYLEFTDSGTAIVRWRTKHSMPTALEYGLVERANRVEDARPKQNHEATLTGLKPRRVYSYAIRLRRNGQESLTPSYECDTHFDFSPVSDGETVNPFPHDSLSDRYRDAADRILATSRIDRGVCLVYGSGEGRLAYELATRSRLRIVGVDTNAERVARARRALSAAGLYGTRVTVRHVASLDKLSFTSRFANLVVSETLLEGNEIPGNVTELCRALRPDGGIAILCPVGGQPGSAMKQRLSTWLEGAPIDFQIEGMGGSLVASAIRPPLDGAGEWSHQYARVDNSAFGLESLGGASRVEDLDVQWLGRPGPRAQPDRNGRKPSPLAVGGRLFVQGLHRIIAVDQYNGTILWSLEMPALERFNLPRDTSNWCADADSLYVAIEGSCWRINAANGELREVRSVASKPRSEWRYDWGYVARAGDLLLGSAVKAGTAYTNFWGGAGAGWYDATEGPATHKVGSDSLFALRVDSNETVWNYSDRIVINSTITIGDGSIYFVEARHPSVMAADTRRLGMPELWQQQFLVALDLATGAKLWERPLEVAEGRVAFYQSYAQGKLLIVASGAGTYHVYAFDSTDGAELWNDSFDWPSDNHGGHMARPATVGNLVYVRPHAYELATGRRLDSLVPGGKCGTYAVTKNAVIFRGPGNLTMWDSETGEASSWSRLRPDCWLSTIPAGGMLLSPEAGGGCSCGSWIETSLGFAPIAHAEPQE